MALLGRADWESFRSPDSEIPPDVFFLVKGEDGKSSKIGAHRILLAGISPVFRRMFFGSMKETGETMEMKDTSPDTFGAMINYIYTRHPDDVLYGIGSPKILFELFALADMYDILDLKTEILNSLQEFEINHENLIYTATVANCYRGFYADISTKLLMLCLKFYLKLGSTDKDALLENSDDILQELMEAGRSTLQLPGNSFCRTLTSQFCRLGQPSVL